MAGNKLAQTQFACDRWEVMNIHSKQEYERLTKLSDDIYLYKYVYIYIIRSRHDSNWSLATQVLLSPPHIINET